MKHWTKFKPDAYAGYGGLHQHYSIADQKEFIKRFIKRGGSFGDIVAASRKLRAPISATGREA